MWRLGPISVNVTLASGAYLEHTPYKEKGLTYAVVRNKGVMTSRGKISIANSHCSLDSIYTN